MSPVPDLALGIILGACGLLALELVALALYLALPHGDEPTDEHEGWP
jgi:hypothetical protein